MSLNWRDWSVLPYTNLDTLEHLAERFEFLDDDILINTYYKSGTTLTQELVYSLLHGVEAAKSSNLWIRSPFLDWGRPDPQTGKRPLDWTPELARPRVLKTHLPPAFHMRHLNKTAGGPRVLVVMRNPKDTIVSAYHHFVSMKEQSQSPSKDFSQSWQTYAVGSGTGGSVYHNYFDFTLSWWSQRDHPRVRVYFYEDMISRKAETVRSIAEFLGVRTTEEQVQAVVEHTGFQSMRENPNVNPTLNEATKGLFVNEFNFIRKGQVGDWKNHFTVADNELMDRLIRERLDPAGLKFSYE